MHAGPKGMQTKLCMLRGCRHRGQSRQTGCGWLAGPRCGLPDCNAHGRRGAQEAFRELYRARQMEERKIKVEVAAARPGLGGAVVEGMPNPAAMQAMLSTLEKAMARSPGASQLRELTIAEARPLLEEAETERLVTSDSVRAPRQGFQLYPGLGPASPRVRALPSGAVADAW